jgi:hypothetical protein
LSNIILIKVKAKIKIALRTETKDGRYVCIVLSNVKIDPLENARKNIITTMGQLKRSSVDKKDEGSVRTLQWMINKISSD